VTLTAVVEDIFSCYALSVFDCTNDCFVQGIVSYNLTDKKPSYR